MYIDCDTLVIGNCNDVWNISLNNKAIACSYDCLRNDYKKVIGIGINERYFNSGIMLIDIQAWRNNKCFEKIMNHVKNVRSSYPLVDQDFINCALSDEISVLPQQYNFESQLFLYKYSWILRIYNLQPAYWNSKIDFEYAKKNIKICHFCGNTYGRPWYKNSHHPMKEIYDTYYNESPWADENQSVYDLSLAYKLQYLCTKPMLKWTSVFWGMIQRYFIWRTYKV